MVNRVQRWRCPPDKGFEIRALAVWGRARYLSVTEAPHNTDFHTWMGKKHFCFFQTAQTGNRTPNSSVWGFCSTSILNAINWFKGTNFRNIPEQILHRSPTRDQIITFIKDSTSHANCECFTLILHYYKCPYSATMNILLPVMEGENY